MGFRNRSFRRKEPSKKEIKARQKIRQEESEKAFTHIIEFASEFEEKFELLKIYNEGTADFFSEVEFETNKIHVIRGNNGQGKSTLLKNIANSLALNVLSSVKNRMKVVSNNKELANLLNPSLEYSPYKLKEDSIFGKDLNSNLSNQKSNITIYCDFSISFFRESSSNLASDIVQDYDNHSNGERKIKGINDILGMIKFISTISEVKRGINLSIIMDEPESGLSTEIQEEFYKKLKRYINKFIKDNKITLTFIIASHSLIWRNEKVIAIHDINEFKKNERKKEHKSVFI